MDCLVGVLDANSQIREELSLSYGGEKRSFENGLFLTY